MGCAGSKTSAKMLKEEAEWFRGLRLYKSSGLKGEDSLRDVAIKAASCCSCIGACGLFSDAKNAKWSLRDVR